VPNPRKIASVRPSTLLSVGKMVRPIQIPVWPNVRVSPTPAVPVLIAGPPLQIASVPCNTILFAEMMAGRIQILVALVALKLLIKKVFASRPISVFAFNPIIQFVERMGKPTPIPVPRAVPG